MTWILVGACGAAALLIFYVRSEHEKRYFTVDTYEVRSGKIADGERTLVFLSDLHNNCFGEGQKELLEAIDKVKPDAVLIGGDMMVTAGNKEEVDTDIALHLVKRLAERYPVYYGFGNHESRMEWREDILGNAYEEYCGKLLTYGVRLVKGRKRYRIGTDIAVAGLELPRGCYRKVSSDHIETDIIMRQAGPADENRYQILLAHTPAFFDQYRTWGADLTLSGHFHGGTIRIPILGGVMTPQCKFFDPYCAGQFEKNGCTMIVSRGLGTHSINIRLNNPSQVVVVKLKGK